MSKKVIGIASDHAGYAYKQAIHQSLEQDGFEMRDFGTHSEESTDYPDYAHALAEAIENGEFEQGIVICGSGQGVCMTVNKHPGVRGALVWNDEISALARQHNNANVICLPARFISLEDALKFVHTFLETEFEGGRHQRRVGKIPC